MNTKTEEINKSSNYPKNKKDLSNYRIKILEDKSFEKFINKGSYYLAPNQMNNIISGIGKTNGLSTTVRSAYVNGSGSLSTGSLTTSNRQIVSAHLHDIVANAYIQTAVPQVKQVITEDFLRGKSANVTSDLNNTVNTLNTTQEISMYNNMFKVTNNNYVYTQDNAFFAGFGKEVKNLETVSFAYELLKIMAIRDQTIEYAGGLNLVYSGNTKTVTRTALNEGNYFPESVNAVNPNIDFYACTLAQLNEYHPPNDITLIPILKSDIYQRAANNSWAMVYMETPFKDFNEAITLNTDVANLFKTFSNSTIIPGGTVSFCFVIVDDGQNDNVDVKIGQAVDINTQVNNPWTGVAQVVTMNDVTGVGGVVQYDTLLMYERWCNYFYNEEDIEQVIRIMSLAFHKVPLLQSAFFSITGVAVNGVLGLRDADRGNRTLLLSTNGDLLNNATYRVSITDNKIWVDSLYQKMTLDPLQMEYLVESTSFRMRVAAVRHMLTGYGTTLNVKTMDFIWYQGCILANKIGVCSDISRMISSKPANIEIINPVACNITNQIMKTYGFPFKTILDKYFTMTFGRNTKNTGKWNVITMANSIQFTLQKFDVGGLYNMNLFPYAIENHFNLNQKIINNFKLVRDQTAGTIGYAKTYSIENVLLEQRNDYVETFEDTMSMYQLFRMNGWNYILGMTVTDQSLAATIQPFTAYDGTALNQLLTSVFRIYNRRCINIATGWMNVKQFTNVTLPSIVNNTGTDFLTDQFDEDQLFKNLDKDELKEKDEMDQVDFLITIPEKKI